MEDTRTGEAPQGRGLTPSHPGVHLADALDGLKAEAGVSRAAVAERLGIGRRSLYNVLEHRQPVTPEFALRLEALGLGSAESWLNLQQAYDLAIARKALSAELEAIAPAWPAERAKSAA